VVWPSGSLGEGHHLGRLDPEHGGGELAVEEFAAHAASELATPCEFLVFQRSIG
jgi:hypothetical protein